MWTAARCVTEDSRIASVSSFGGQFGAAYTRKIGTSIDLTCMLSYRPGPVGSVFEPSPSAVGSRGTYGLAGAERSQTSGRMIWEIVRRKRVARLISPTYCNETITRTRCLATTGSTSQPNEGHRSMLAASPSAVGSKGTYGFAGAERSQTSRATIWEIVRRQPRQLHALTFRTYQFNDVDRNSHAHAEFLFNFGFLRIGKVLRPPEREPLEPNGTVAGLACST